MKKTLNNIGIVALSAMLFVACERNDELATVGTAVAPAFAENSVAAAYTVTADNLLKTISFPIKTANYGINTDVKSVLEVALPGTNFIKPSVVGIPVSGDKIEITYKQLNDVVTSLGLKPGETSKVEIRIKSYLNSLSVSTGIQPTYSEAKTISVVAYQAAPKYQYQDWYLVGNSTAAGWDNSAANMNMFPLQKTADANVYTFTGFFKKSVDPGNDGVKLIKSKGSWDINFGGTNGTLANGGSNIQIPADGYYKITVNFSTNKYSLDSVDVSKFPVFQTVGIIGSATPKSWDSSTPMVQSAFDKHIWMLTGFKLKEGEFKFRANDSWDKSWGGNTEFFGSNGNNIPVSMTYLYDIYFNDITGEYTFIPVK